MDEEIRLKPAQTFVSAMLIVCSVFMGFQVDRWWQEQQELEIEDNYLERLIEDVKTDGSQLKRRIEYFENVRKSGLLALEYLDGPPEHERPPAEYLAAFYLASQAWEFTPAITTFEELKSSGALSLIRDVSLRTTLAIYYQSMAESNYVWKTPNYYRRSIRSLIPPLLQRMLWEECHKMESQGAQQEFSEQCSTSISSEDASQILGDIRQSGDVERNLNFMMSNLDISLDLFRSHLARTQEVAAALADARVKRG
jgi:hypothetical protein